MASLGAHPLLWRLAMSPAIPADLPGVLELPATILWQAEILVEHSVRVERIRAAEAETDRVLHAGSRRV